MLWKRNVMVIKYPKSDKDSIFDLNPVLKTLFPKLEEHEMRYVALVADALSPFRFKANKHELANKCLNGKRVRRAHTEDVKIYDEALNPPKQKMLRDMLASYYSQFESIKDALAYKDSVNAQSPEDTIKIQNQCNSIIKDGLDKKVWDNIEYYESRLGFEYEPPADVASEINKKDKKSTESADDIDPSALW